ncbi:MAG TPA: hypothetical protein DD438_01965, partial [Verrucomicrobiales bacterium]|nr:hypothetical protein [Verrucomicrobiales bacterium]
RFFEKHLKLSQGLQWKNQEDATMNESTVLLESHQTLQVFTGKHPVPPHALKPNSPVTFSR